MLGHILKVFTKYTIRKHTIRALGCTLTSTRLEVFLRLYMWNYLNADFTAECRATQTTALQIRCCNQPPSNSIYMEMNYFDYNKLIVLLVDWDPVCLSSCARRSCIACNTYMFFLSCLKSISLCISDDCGTILIFIDEQIPTGTKITSVWRQRRGTMIYSFNGQPLVSSGFINGHHIEKNGKNSGIGFFLFKSLLWVTKFRLIFSLLWDTYSKCRLSLSLLWDTKR